MKRKICIIVLSGLFFLSLCIGLLVWQKKSQAESIDELIKEMYRISEEKIKNDPGSGLSSNPYDYIQENDAYDAIVEYGVEAVPQLMEELESSDSNGLDSYLIAIAIEDIMKCDLKETIYMWSDAKGFLGQWESLMDDREKLVLEILDENETVQGQEEQLKPYGKIAAATLEEIRSNKQVEEKYRKQAEKIDLGIHVDRKEQKIIEEKICNGNK